MAVYPRKIENEIQEALSWFPVIGIIGPRQVGKTTLAKTLMGNMLKESVYIDLELDEDNAKLENAQLFLQTQQDKCIIIDEIQLKPELFSLIRALVDQDRRPARFILLGSATPELIRGTSESLAGRISYHELSPFSITEVMKDLKMEEHWFKGGFPDALFAPSAKIRNLWIKNFMSTFIEKDLAQLGQAVSPVTMRNLYSMLAAVHGTELNSNMLARSLGVSHPTVRRYIDLLEGGFLVSRLQPYHANIKKRLVKSPKVYLRDSGILHYLSKVPDFIALSGHPILGNSWEGYVIEQIKRELGNDYEYYFYRTQAGAEIDLFIITPNGRKIAIEIKYSVTPKLKKGYHESVKDLQPDQQYVIIPSGTSYPISEDIQVVNLTTFLNEVCPEL